MKNLLLSGWRAALGCAGICLGIASGVDAGPFQLVSSSSQSGSSGGGGDSRGAILSGDGRFVLFSSTADNLALLSNNAPMPGVVPARYNVFLRDRANGTTRLVSINTNGTGGGNGDSLAAGLSADGRFALFESSASDLATNDLNNATDIFLRDMVGGRTLLVSSRTNGGAGNADSRNAVMTPDGRFVAFVSRADNLVAGDTNKITDIFVVDTQLGTTVLASPGAMSTNLTVSAGGSEVPDISEDGRYVAFLSTATNLVRGIRTAGDIYVRDLVAGTTYWASSGARGAFFAAFGNSNAICYSHAISADGRFVGYQVGRAPDSVTTYPALILRFGVESGLTDLVYTNAPAAKFGFEDIRNLSVNADGRFVAFVANTNGTSGATTCIRLWDAVTGAASLVSGDAVPANTTCDWPVLDAAGRYVAFLSTAPGLTTNALIGGYHLYVRDAQAGTTALVDVDTNGVGSGVTPSAAPFLSENGGQVAFDAGDGSLVSGDRNQENDVFVRDLAAGTTEMISRHAPALASATPNGPSRISGLSVSADGRYVAFASDADDVVADDTNGYRDVFVRDLLGGGRVLASVAINGAAGNGVSTDPVLSADGRYVAFVSTSTNFTSVTDLNKVQDVFLRDLQTGTTTLVSVKAGGTAAGNSSSFSPSLSTDGRYLLFVSRATDLVAPATGSTSNLFLRDLQTGTIVALTQTGVSAASMTPDGRFVAYGTGGKLFVWDSQSGRNVCTNSTAGILRVAISPDGRQCAYWLSSQLYLADRIAGTSKLVVTSQGPSARAGLKFSGDNRFLAYGAGVAGTQQVFVYDLQSGVVGLVSHAEFSATTPANGGHSDSSDISTDGRFVVYRSAATNIVSGDENGVPDIFLFDRLTGANKVLSADPSGAPADDRSFTPVFSGDGQSVMFVTWAANLAANDFNHSGDVLSYALLMAIIIPSPQGPWLSWPFVPDNNYRVEFKDNLEDPLWQELPGIPTNSGTKAYLQDTTFPLSRRFYRITSF